MIRMCAICMSANLTQKNHVSEAVLCNEKDVELQPERIPGNPEGRRPEGLLNGTLEG